MSFLRLFPRRSFPALLKALLLSGPQFRGARFIGQTRITRIRLPPQGPIFWFAGFGFRRFLLALLHRFPYAASMFVSPHLAKDGTPRSAIRMATSSREGWPTGGGHCWQRDMSDRTTRVTRECHKGKANATDASQTRDRRATDSRQRQAGKTRQKIRQKIRQKTHVGKRRTAEKRRTSHTISQTCFGDDLAVGRGSLSRGNGES